MYKLLLSSKIVSAENLKLCRDDLERDRMAGKIPRKFIDVVIERDLINQRQQNAFLKAAERLERDRIRSYLDIKGYRIIRKIGGGGLGTVYQAYQITMLRNVAIKVLHPKWANDEEFRSRFILEARVMGRLSHQNLIQVHDVGLEGQNYFFTMEYIEGPTVQDLIKKQGRVDPGEALHITLQMARVINYISRYDIIHRDIKPANILLSDTGIAKLGDFGFLHSKYEKRLGQEGYVIGTPDYISPEQAMGKKVDFRSDIYSLGVCLYHMLSGKLPYHGSVSTVMRQHIDDEIPEPILSEGDKVSPHLFHVISKMMAKDPKDRFQKVTELLDELGYLRAQETMKKGVPNRRNYIVETPTENSGKSSQKSEIPGSSHVDRKTATLPQTNNLPTDAKFEDGLISYLQKHNNTLLYGLMISILVNLLLVFILIFMR
ncbi:MAG: serine/threonine protein kinase [Planctomycetes bacterium]|nr:serine/threonine protein kinase [Planctomycetota bacterium]